MIGFLRTLTIVGTVLGIVAVGVSVLLTLRARRKRRANLKAA